MFLLENASDHVILRLIEIIAVSANYHRIIYHLRWVLIH